jgi:phage replication initiation protein
MRLGHVAVVSEVLTDRVIRVTHANWGGSRGKVEENVTVVDVSDANDWSAVKVWAEASGAWISRLDLAHDDFEGRTVTIRKARRWYRAGGFTANGRRPVALLYHDLGSGKGKTFQVGERESGKLVRIYEKGKQLGDPASPWVRVEVEWRNKDRLIPWDAVTRPGPYLAGAYPCLAFLSAEQSRIRTARAIFDTSYERMVQTVRRNAGRMLNVMLHVNRGDAAAVLLQVVRPGVPKRLQGTHFGDDGPCEP